MRWLRNRSDSLLDGGEIKVFAPVSDQAVDNFEDSGHRKFNPTFGELVAIKAFHKYDLATEVAEVCGPGCVAPFGVRTP